MLDLVYVIILTQLNLQTTWNDANPLATKDKNWSVQKKILEVSQFHTISDQYKF